MCFHKHFCLIFLTCFVIPWGIFYVLLLCIKFSPPWWQVICLNIFLIFIFAAFSLLDIWFQLWLILILTLLLIIIVIIVVEIIISIIILVVRSIFGYCILFEWKWRLFTCTILMSNSVVNWPFLKVTIFVRYILVVCKG